MISLNMHGGKLNNQEGQNDHNNNGLQESFFFMSNYPVTNMERITAVHQCYYASLFVTN
jgi:hypothetical protein